MTTPDIPLLDISVWRGGTATQRRELAATMDRALRRSGFLLTGNHGVPAGLRQRIRVEAGKFFALPAERKRAYATPVGGRGWIPQGGEANAFYGEVADPARADLKESITNGRDFLTGDAAVDAQWFAPNVWPAECPDLAALAGEFTEQARALYYDLLRMGAVALGLDEELFVSRVLRGPQTFNINRYPPLSVTGPAREGQYRVAPHTDWGILTILDRQPGYGGLQVQALDGTWTDAPYVPDAFTVNVADLLSRWTGERWRSTSLRCIAVPALLALQSRLFEGVSALATLTIRGLDAVTHARLRVEAARHGRSMEAEVRAILQERLATPGVERGLGTRIRARFQGLEGDLGLPDRSSELPRAAEFDR